jgi:hypothetical protein
MYRYPKQEDQVKRKNLSAKKEKDKLIKILRTKRSSFRKELAIAMRGFIWQNTTPLPNIG